MHRLWLLGVVLSIGTFVSAHAGGTVSLGISSGRDCNELLSQPAQRVEQVQINANPLIVQNRRVGGCTLLWPSSDEGVEELVLTIASNHPKAVTFQFEENQPKTLAFNTPVSERPLQYRFFAAQLGQLKHGSPIVIEQRGLFNVPVEVMTKAYFEQSESRAKFVAGSLLSVWLLVLATSIITYFISRKVIFLAYGLLALASGLMVFSKTGFGQSFIWVDFPGLTDTFVSLSGPIAGLAIGLLLFVSLDALVRAPNFFKWLVGISILAVLATALRFIAGWDEFESIAHLVLVGPFVFCLAMTLVRCYEPKPVETGLLALAILGLSSGVLISNLSHLGLINDSIFAVRASEIGAGFDLFIAWILIAVKVYIDNKKAQELAQELLELKDKREADLSRLVDERTELLNNSNAEKTRLLQDFLTFSRYLTHDVRNPLTNISNQATLIAGDVDTKSSVHSRLRSMGGSIKRISSLFDDWLIVQRMSLGFHSPSLSQFELSHFISDVMSELPYREQVNVDFQGQAAQTQVTWDQGLIKRVLHNLLDNAKRYADSEMGFRLVVQNCDGFIHLEIIDFGQIPYEHIASRLWRQEGVSDPDRSGSDGSGLGTAFIAYAIKLHKGKITTSDSSQGRGLRVRIILSSNPIR